MATALSAPVSPQMSDAVPEPELPLVSPGAFEAASGAFLFGLLHVLGLGGDAPLWVIGLATTGMVAGQVRPTALLLRRAAWARRLELRIGVSTSCVAVMTFGTGWGSLMVAGLLMQVIADVRQFGSGVWRKAVLWCVFTSSVGQVLVATHTTSTNLPVGIAHGAFAAGIISLVICGRGYGTTCQKLEETEARFRSLVQNSHDLVLLADVEGNFVYVSPASVPVLGYEPEWLMQNGWQDLVHVEDRQLCQDNLVTLSEPRSSVSYEIRARHADGSWRWWEITAYNMVHDPAVRGLVCHIRDVTERRAYQEKLSYQATRDNLTGLLNRPAFLEALEAGLARARRHLGTTAVLFLDLDGFKAVNDTWGHHAGDVLLQTIATRMQAVVRPGDTVARFAGDEFVVLLESLESPAEAQIIADRIQRELESPLVLDGKTLQPAASVGVTVTTSAVQTGSELIRAADLQMYKAKQSRSKATYVEPDSSPGERTPLDRAAFQDGLRNNEFFVEYQPIVDLVSGAAVGVEALARWRHPTLGMVPPDVFIPRAEQTGTIAAVGRRVLEDACLTVFTWRETAGLDLSLAVNASVSQLRDPSFVSVVRSVLAETQFPANRLVVEVTESLPVLFHDAALTTLAALRELGVRVALDDFGSGYASLDHVDRLPVDIVKLDRSLITRLTDSERGAAQLTALTHLLATMQVDVVAEGVEEASQAEVIERSGVRLVQGYHFARPASAQSTLASLIAALASVPVTVGGVPAQRGR